MKKRIVIFLAVISLLSFAGNVFPATYYVSKNGNDANNGLSWAASMLNIKTALGKCASGDSIWIAGGKYIEGATLTVGAGVSLYGGFAGNESSISERIADSNPTIIDGNNNYKCISAVSTLLDGLNITNGGGGIYCEDSTVNNCNVYFNQGYSGIYAKNSTISNNRIYSNMCMDQMGAGIYGDHCTITNSLVYSNSAASAGGGIYLNYGTISDCSVTTNTVGPSIFSSSYSDGGGIYGNEAVVKRCVVYGNIATGSNSSGGGIRMRRGYILNSQVYSNSATDSQSKGGGICVTGGLVRDCRIYSNYCANNGGGIFGYSGSISPYTSPQIENCLIFSNSAVNYGGGANFNMTGKIYNDTVYGNSAGVTGSGVLGASQINSSIIWNNTGGDGIQVNGSSIYNSCYNASTGSNGNINSDPLFVKTSGDSSTWDFHLTSESPCIDKGEDIYSYPRDYDGRVRPWGDSFDMGAYEYGSFYPGDVNKDNTVDAADRDLLSNYIIKKTELDEGQLIIADMYIDEKIDVADLVKLIMRMGEK